MPHALPRLFHLAAALELFPADGESPRRFRMTAYDGGLLRLAGVPVPVVVDLTGLKAAPQVKALLHHDTKKPVGHMERVEIGATIETEGVLSVPEHAGTILEAQRNGFQWEASIGAAVDQVEKVPAGRNVAVNGRQFRGPLVVVRQGTLREVSFVGAGAGENTSATVLTAIAVSEDPIMSKETAGNGTADTTTDTAAGTPPEGKSELEALQALRAEIRADMDALRREREAMRAEFEQRDRQRTAESVDTIAASLGVTDADLLNDLRQKAAAGEIKENQVELQLLRASRTGKLAGFLPVGGKTGAPAVPHVIEAALCLTAGWSEPELKKHFDEKTIGESLEARWQGFGPRSLMIEYLRAHGHHVIGGRLQQEDIQTGIMLAEQQLRAAGGFSTISLPGILSNVARKELLRGYDAFPGAILKIAKRATATDYKPFFMYRLTTSGLLEQVGPDGELRSIDLKEDEYQSRVYPFGRKLTLTDVMFRNDDLGAFSDLARLFGVTTVRTIEKRGFTVLLSDQANFWTTAKGNRVASGAGSALSLTSLGSAYQLFLEAKDASGEPIGIPAKYLLTAPKDAVTARNLNQSTTINLAVSPDSDQTAADVLYERPASNPFVGMFEPLVSPYLASGQVTNANGTQWILAADPAITASIVAAFLDGREGPQIRTWEALPGKLGMQWDISCHFGFNLHDDRGSVYSPGQ